jgi:hypothetical protein
MESREKTPAQLYALIFGATLLLAGVVGFAVDATFGNVGSDVEGDELILFEVNGWHNLVHLTSGLLGLATYARPGAARAYAIGFGTVYLGVTLWGFIAGDQALFGLLPINTADNFLHLAISLTGIAAGLLSDPERSRGAAAA